jgi:hypothetical protein
MPTVNGVGEPCAGERMHGSMWRELEPEHDQAMVMEKNNGSTTYR